MAQQPNKINGKNVFIFLAGDPHGRNALDSGFSAPVVGGGKGNTRMTSIAMEIQSMITSNQLGHYIREMNDLSAGGMEVHMANIDLHANPDNSIVIAIVDSPSASVAQLEGIKTKYPNARLVLLDRREEGQKDPVLLTYFHGEQFPVIEIAPRTVEGCANLQAALNLILMRESGDKTARFAGGIPNNGYLSQAGVLLHPGFERGGM